MAAPLLKRLVWVVTAVAFVLAAALPGSVHAVPATGTMIDGMQKASPECPGNAPTGNECAKYGCAALACIGISVALPNREPLKLPVFAATDYPLAVFPDPLGLTPVPDPLPPRPTFLV